MSADRPGGVRRAALSAFRRLPAGPSWAIVRLAAPTFSMGAVALIEHDGHLLALRQLHRSGWSLPGGLLDRGEQPDDAVIREVREETGLDIEPGDAMATVVDPDVRHIDVIFRVQASARPPVRPASEATRADWFRLADFPEADASTRRILRAVRAANVAPRAGRLL